MLNQLRDGLPTLGGAADYHLNLAHRDDIVSALLACLTAPAKAKNEIFNVADAAPERRGEVVRWLAGRLGCVMPTFDGSAGARRSGEPMPDRLVSSGKIRRMLGWRPQFPDFRAGFGQILAK